MINDKHKEGEIKGTVFDIQRFSLHDGYGIRTLVFLKGCPLRCQWCSNPESQSPKPQMGYYKERCVFCMKCVKVCSCGQVTKPDAQINWDKCDHNDICADICDYNARAVIGKTMTVEEIAEIVKRDKPFYEASSGGLTLGGGEPTSQPEFARAILAKCQKLNIHTAMETCGYAPWDAFKSVIEHVDLLLFDIKHMDSDKHKQYTGVGNELIHMNAIKVSELVDEMILRLPLLPGFNDDWGNIKALGEFIQTKMPKIKRIDVLPYHSTGESKCAQIGKPYPFVPTHQLDDEAINTCKQILENVGLDVIIGG